MKRFQRKNGFSRPPGTWQIAGSCLFLLEVISVCLFILPFLQIAFKVTLNQVLSCVLIVSICAFIVFWVRVSRETHKDSKEYNAETGKLCNFCLNFVSFDSKHCKICNKCVARFDHHCKVLNTCIGKANYSDFIKTLCFFLIITIMISAFSALFIHDHSNNYKRLKTNTSSLAKIFSIEGVFIISIICLIIGVILSVSISLLIVFHLVLKRKNLTTYEYILIKRQRKAKGIETGESASQKIDLEVTKIIPRLTLS